MKLSQKEIIARLEPHFLEAKIYEKYTTAYVRPAKIGEEIVTITGDGVETQNRAKADDFVIMNDTKAKEQYIISGEKLRKRYEPTGEKMEDGEIYKAVGKCRAIKVNSKLLKQLDAPDVFEFTAPWGEPMVCKKGDMLVCPELYGTVNEVYRIALKEFKETYR